MRAVRSLSIRRWLVGMAAVGLTGWAASSSLEAQQFNTTAYGIEDGLAQSQPEAIVQGRTGHLWIGTLGGGISRFDGLTFRNFTSRDGLASDIVVDLAEDHEGVMWVATDVGLSRFDGLRFENVDLADLGRVVVTGIARATMGGVWVATAGQGAFRFDGAIADRLHRGTGLAGDSVGAIHVAADGTVWLGTPQGACARQPSGALECYDVDDGLTHSGVLAIADAPDGGLLLGTERGVTEFDGSRFGASRHAPLRDVRASHIAAGRASVWIGTDRGLLRIAGDVVEVYEGASRLADDVETLFVDREENLWIGSSSDGLVRFVDSPFALFDERHGLADEVVWTILEDREGQLWFGSNGGLTSYVGGRMVNYARSAGSQRETVYSSVLEADGTPLFATRTGLARVVGGELRRVPGDPVTTRIWSLARDSSGAIWIGTPDRGAYRFAGGRFTPFGVADGLPDDPINAIGIAADGSVWFGLSGRIAFYRNGRFNTIDLPDHLGSKSVTAIVEGTGGGLWISTYGAGIARYQPRADGVASPFRSITVADGLSDLYVNSLLPDGDDLWVCTNQGLNRLDLAALHAGAGVQVRRYGAGEGFVGIECNSGAAFRDDTGTLWFGTAAGVMRYAPALERRSVGAPEVMIVDTRLFFERVDWRELGYPSASLPSDPELSHDDNHVTFDFVAINLQAPRSVRYEYMLDGVDPGWTPPSIDRSATYANLRPGSYTFQVRAAIGDGPWSAQPASFPFTIAPPFWRTPWFITLFALGGTWSMVSAARWRDRTYRHRQELLHSMVEARTRELEAEKANVIAANARLEDLSLASRHTDNALLIADTEARIVWVNEGFTRMTGFTRETLCERGDTLIDLSSNPDIETVLGEAFAYGMSAQYESLLRRSDGSELWVSSALTPIISDDGVVKKIVVVDTDISELKSLELDLIAAREAAEEAARAKSDFLANMSHEIRTPMNGVIGMTSLLLDTHLENDQREFVDIIRTSGEALLAVINDILDFSKIEAGKIDLEEHPFAVHAVVEDALDLVTQAANAKGLELAYLAAADVPVGLNGDVTRVRQVLTNLLSNAVKFTHEGEVTVHVAASRRSDDAFDMHFSVRDTGVGIAPDRLNRLFKSFSQVDGSTTREYGGTGLGLAISMRLAELMGGTIWVESEVGVGSTFHFTVLAREAAVPSGRNLAGLDILRGKRALVVDDNATNRRVVEVKLDRLGMDVTTAVSGEAALAILEDGAGFDVGLLDMQMPGMDGLTLARRIAEQDGPPMPLVMLSSVGQLGNLDGTNLTAWLTKPLKLEPLGKVLRQVLGGKAPANRRVDAANDEPMAAAHPLRILVVEDNVVNQKVLVRLLDRLGYRADVVANGLEAVSAVALSRYDVVLMDLQMPEMDGLQATRAIRRDHETTERPRIVAVTANATQSDRDACYDAGMDDYISKPIRIEALVEVLEASSWSAPSLSGP